MSLFGRWSKEDDDYHEKVNQNAKKDLNAQLIRARDNYEKNPTPSARAAMNDIEDQLRGRR